MRFCLAGDVEAPSAVHRGWNGVIDYLTAECGGDHLLRDLQLLKLAHHGSKGAYSARAFALHAQTRRVPVAIATPFGSGSDAPPHPQALREVRKHSALLALTAEPVCTWAEVEAAGWLEELRSSDAGASCVVASFEADGTVEVEVYGGARAFR